MTSVRSTGTEEAKGRKQREGSSPFISAAGEICRKISKRKHPMAQTAAKGIL